MSYLQGKNWFFLQLENSLAFKGAKLGTFHQLSQSKHSLSPILQLSYLQIRRQRWSKNLRERKKKSQNWLGWKRLPRSGSSTFGWTPPHPVTVMHCRNPWKKEVSIKHKCFCAPSLSFLFSQTCFWEELDVANTVTTYNTQRTSSQKFTWLAPGYWFYRPNAILFSHVCANRWKAKNNQIGYWPPCRGWYWQNCFTA